MKAIFTFVFLFFSLNFFAQESLLSDDEALASKKRLMQVSENTQSISSHFTLEKHMSMMAKPVVSSGRFFYSAPNKIRWEEIEPQEYLLLLSGNEVYASNQDKFKNTRHLEAIKELMLGSVNGDLIESDQFEKTFLKEDENFIVRLQPVSGKLKRNLADIMLAFTESDMRLQSIRMNDSEGDYTLIKFYQTEFDKPLDTDLFVKPE